MRKLNRTVSCLVITTVASVTAVGFCLYMAWRGDATAKPLWGVIAALVAVLGGMIFQLFRARRT